MVEAIRDCEALVAAVARAFYPDDVAIVLDALIRDRYVRGATIQAARSAGGVV